MKISQVLNERISLTHIVPYLENFIIKMFQANTTAHTANGTLALDLGSVSLTELDKMLDRYNFSDFMQGILNEVMGIDANLKVIHGKKNLNLGSAMRTNSRGNTVLSYDFLLDYTDMEHLIDAYRSSNILGKLYQIEDTWHIENDNSTLTYERARQLIQKKDDIIASGFPKAAGFRHFCGVVVHELTHLATEHAAFSNYNKNQEKYSSKILPHRAAQAALQAKLTKGKLGLDSHFAEPAELESYAQEVASRIKYAIDYSQQVPVKYIRKQLTHLIQTYRKEVAYNLHNLTPTQQKYIYKLYKRVYQEIADILEGAKK